MRCLACNKVLDDDELANINENTGKPEDLCSICLYYADDALNEFGDDL